MKNIKVPGQNINPLESYCVSYVTAIVGEQLDDNNSEYQLQQDEMVVQASSDVEALQVARELLEARCEFEFVITKVDNRASLEFRLSTVLGRVERGEAPPATLADKDHYVWAERYVYCTEESKSAGNTP